MRNEAGPKPCDSRNDSIVPARPLDLWPEQLNYVRGQSFYELRDWLERLYDGRPFPVLLLGTDPSVFAINLYKSGPKEFQQRFRAAMRNLVLSYHPALNPGVPYLGNLVYVCGQLRIVEAYGTFMELVYTRSLEGEFATDRDRAAGHDVHSHLLAAAGALRPPHDDGILHYCRRVLEGEFPSHYGEVAYEILWKADEKNANQFFSQFVETLASRPEVELLDSVRRQCWEIKDRYGPISLNGRARKLLEECSAGPVKDMRLRRARLMLYATLLLLGVKATPRRGRRLSRSPARSQTVVRDDDITYAYMYDELVDQLRRRYGANSLKNIYGDIPIGDAIEIYVAEIPCLSELQSIFLDENRLYRTELNLVRTAAERSHFSSKIALTKSKELGNLFDPGITRDELVERLEAALS